MLRQKLIINIWLLHLLCFLSLHTLLTMQGHRNLKIAGWSQNLKRDHLQGLRNGKVILKWMLQKLSAALSTGFIWFRIRTSGGLLWKRRWNFGLLNTKGNTWPAKGTLASPSLLCNVKSEVAERKFGHNEAPAHWAPNPTRRECWLWSGLLINYSFRTHWLLCIPSGFVHLFRRLPYDRSTASSKASSPHSAI